MKKPYILLDAGGTLVFPDVKWLSNLMGEYGLKVSEEQILKRVYEIDYLIDKSMKERITFLEDGNLLKALFRAFTDSEKKIEELKTKTDERDRIKNLWAYTFPWVKETLEKLKDDGYSISIVSNSDGRAAKVIEEVGLSQFIDRIYDSQIVGFEKPDPEIFKKALIELNLSPDEAIFFGDMFYTDVLGANRVKMGAVHLDPFNFYKGWPGKRIANVKDIPELLSEIDLSAKSFFPFLFDLKEN